MRQTDRDIQGRNADLMRLVGILLRSAMMLTVVVASLLAVVSCGSGSGDDPGTPGTTPGGTTPGRPDAPEVDMPILFSAAQQEDTPVTRAETPLNEKGITSFKVFGFKTSSTGALQKVFPGYNVNWVRNSVNTTTTNTSNWEYVNQQPKGDLEQTIKYWDWSSQAYRFFGVAGASSTNEVKGKEDETDDGVKIFKVTYKSDASHEEDTPYYSHMWYSTGVLPQYADRQYGQTVMLQFIKPLSKVRFRFIFEDPSQAKTTMLTEKHFAPSNENTIKTKGNVTVIYPLDGTGITETFGADADAEGMVAFEDDYYESVDYGKLNPEDENEVVVSPYLGADASKTGKEYTVLPVTGQGSYTLHVYVNGVPKRTVVPAEYMNWSPGYQYTYIFKIHVDEGVSISSVQSAFTKWTEHTTDYTFYNW